MAVYSHNTLNCQLVFCRLRQRTHSNGASLKCTRHEPSLTDDSVAPSVAACVVTLLVLNCILARFQVLWHVDTFRRRFRKLDDHTCTDAVYGERSGRCIFCALKVTPHLDRMIDLFFFSYAVSAAMIAKLYAISPINDPPAC